ncbi:uncharacterized protein CDAR_275871 [Caerostris darwini]|uniref:Uncharacterized protein n=1 Tax=Caerostris darwini TaxID=1538125 RepID=A0AAV4RNY4_9ARAC|nr:uncharacterized protein CDAR_275871 [Caerostris darwini]
MKSVMIFFVLFYYFITVVHVDGNKPLKAPSAAFKKESEVEIEHEFNGDCQGNKTYGYFVDCGERCHDYPKYCSAEKVLRCGCFDGYVQIDSTFLSPCVKLQDCPPKSKGYMKKSQMTEDQLDQIMDNYDQY